MWDQQSIFKELLWILFILHVLTQLFRLRPEDVGYDTLERDGGESIKSLNSTQRDTATDPLVGLFVVHQLENNVVLCKVHSHAICQTKCKIISLPFLPYCLLVVPTHSLYYS